MSDAAHSLSIGDSVSLSLREGDIGRSELGRNDPSSSRERDPQAPGSVAA
jgi:hypothetical protein